MESLSGQVFFGQVFPARFVRPGFVWQGFVRPGLTIHVRPPNSDNHNFFFRTLFRVFLDSMESLLSQDSIHVPVEDSGLS